MEKKKFDTAKEVRILYMGTPKIAVRPLEALIDNGFKVVGVITQEDKPQGRKGTLVAPPVKEFALSKGLKVYQPHRMKEEWEQFKALGFDMILCMAYGQIVPLPFLELAPFGALNLHVSLLPQYRGAAPMQRAIMDGLEATGISLMEMVEKMDAGRVYDVRKTKIEDYDDYSSLCSKFGDLAYQMVGEDILPYLNGELEGTPQDESKMTLAKKIKPEEEHLPLSLSAAEASCYIRALSEEPGAYIHIDGKKAKIFAPKVSSLPIKEAGLLHKEGKKLLLDFFDKPLEIGYLQIEGKKKMDASSFLNGFHLPPEGIKVE